MDIMGLSPKMVYFKCLISISWPSFSVSLLIVNEILASFSGCTAAVVSFSYSEETCTVLVPIGLNFLCYVQISLFLAVFPTVSLETKRSRFFHEHLLQVLN
jgi:hypothetical protein